jgi:hypothetical protein
MGCERKYSHPRYPRQPAVRRRSVVRPCAQARRSSRRTPPSRSSTSKASLRSTRTTSRHSRPAPSGRRCGSVRRVQRGRSSWIADAMFFEAIACGATRKLARLARSTPLISRRYGRTLRRRWRACLKRSSQYMKTCPTFQDAHKPSGDRKRRSVSAAVAAEVRPRREASPSTNEVSGRENLTRLIIALRD